MKDDFTGEIEAPMSDEQRQATYNSLLSEYGGQDDPYQKIAIGTDDLIALQAALAASRARESALAAALESMVIAVDALEAETHRTFTADALIEELEADEDRYDAVYAVLWDKRTQAASALEKQAHVSARSDDGGEHG